jgi:hypothetical protein
MATEEELAEIERDFDVPGAKRQVATVMRSFIDFATKHEPTWGLQLPFEDYSASEQQFEKSGERNVMIHAMCDQLTQGWRLGLQGGANEDATLAATRTLLALKAYKQDTGWLPGSLSELVPDYLREIPSDPFDGRPLRYAPLKNIVYSIGADLVDRGGSNRENPVSAQQDKNEPTFQIEF